MVRLTSIISLNLNIINILTAGKLFVTCFIFEYQQYSGNFFFDKIVAVLAKTFFLFEFWDENRLNIFD